MLNRILSAIAACLALSACASQYSVVERTGPDELLKLRAGPGLGYRVILGLPDGTELNRQECVTELGQLWCEVSLVESPEVTGYVSADYITGI
ncbi:SH3 domain-containing protein [Yoonia sp. BS5-3]|uniref:SH3 domain-containing protein n=1 Tax=Yoonia phaeophyticola TaxID=3137369 RepID=A0ABZ3IE19_9RHOB